MATVSVNATASLTANGRTTANGTISWSAPSLPTDATITDISVSGTWTWNGRGAITRVTINGTNTSDGIPFDVSIGTSGTSISISCVGNNKNATGSNFTWSNLQVTYTYTTPVVETDTLYVKLDGSWLEVERAWVKNDSNVWVEQDITTVFNSTDNYLKG